MTAPIKYSTGDGGTPLPARPTSHVTEQPPDGGSGTPSSQNKGGGSLAQQDAIPLMAGAATQEMEEIPQGSQPLANAAQQPKASRVSRQQLQEILERLSGKDLEILDGIGRFRFLTTKHIQKLHFFSGASASANTRAASKALKKLRDLGLVDALPQRIGGVRAGSSALVWHLAEPGSRLLRLRSGGDGPRKRFDTPSTQFLKHTLAVADCAVCLALLCREHGGMSLARLETEPDCWRGYQDYGRTVPLKPDLYAVTTTTEYEEAAGTRSTYEDRWFLEVDLGTEPLTAIVEKCRAYVGYYRSGREQAESGLFPLVVWAVGDGKRKEGIKSAIQDAVLGVPKMFAVVTMEELPQLVLQEFTVGDLV